jgi:hypothetical protein
MTKYRIHVLEQDIAECRYRRQGDPHICMIATATQRAIPEALVIDVDMRYLRFSLARTKLRYFYDLSKVAQVALVAFDDGREVKPFSFWISRGYTTKRRSKEEGFQPSPRIHKNEKKTRRQPPRKREFGMHAFTELPRELQADGVS